MHTEQHHHHHSHGCQEGQSGQSRGPAWFYGYCHDTGRMRMMDYADYVNNTQTTYSNMFGSVPSSLQPYMDMLQGRGGSQPSGQQHPHHHHGHSHDCGCGCHEHGHHEHDCHCSCCIKCADAVEYARCGEIRNIPVTFENDTRRERDVKLDLGAFALSSGKELNWQAQLSETEFKLPPCGEKTVLLRVAVNCAAFSDQPTTPATNDVPGRTPQSVDSCKVAYATLRAEGCTIRPLVIAVAVLPDDCGAHHAGCGCGCCQ